MAKQDSFIKLNGKIGDLSFFKTKEGYQARSKGGVSAERIQNDPGFQRTRENNAEFGEACSASKKVRDSLRSMILLTHDPKMASRLTSRIYKMMKADTTNVRGQRKVKNASFNMLRDFNFNDSAPLNNTLFVQAVPTINRESGVVTMNIPMIRPDVELNKPKGATHFCLTAGAALINVEDETETGVFMVQASDYQRITKDSLPVVLSNSLPPAASGPILLVFSVSFYQEVNGVHYVMNNGTYNALCIVAIDIV